MVLKQQAMLPRTLMTLQAPKKVYVAMPLRPSEAPKEAICCHSHCLLPCL